MWNKSQAIRRRKVGRGKRTARAVLRSLRVYYGAADTSIALATASIAGLLRWLDEHGSMRAER